MVVATKQVECGNVEDFLWFVDKFLKIFHNFNEKIKKKNILVRKKLKYSSVIGHRYKAPQTSAICFVHNKENIKWC